MTMRKVYLTVLLLLFVKSLFAQVDTILIQTKIAEAKELETTGAFQKAFDTYLAAAELYKKEDDWDGYMEVIKEFRRELYDSPIRGSVLAFLLNTEQQISSQPNLEVSPAAMTQLWITIVRMYEISYDFDNMQKYLDKCRQLLEKGPLPNTSWVLMLHYTGRLHYYKEDKVTALSYFDKVIEQGTAINEEMQVIKGKLMKALCLDEHKHLKETLAIYQTILKTLEKYPDEQDQKGDILANMGRNYHRLGDTQKGITYTLKAIATYSNQKSSSAIICYHNLGDYYRILGDADKHLFYAEKSLSLGIEQLGADNPSLIENYRSLGHYYSLKFDVKNSLAQYEKAFVISNKVFPFTRDTLISSISGKTSKTGIGTASMYLSIKSLVAVLFPISPASLKACVRAFSRTEAAILLAANKASKPLSVTIKQ